MNLTSYPAGLRNHLSKPLFAIQKSFKVENAGELPLTVMSMNINGYKCQGFGFEVLQCRSFRVDYNSSSEITIAYVYTQVGSSDIRYCIKEGVMFSLRI